MFQWIKRHWPLVLRSTLEREFHAHDRDLKDYELHLSSLVARAKNAEAAQLVAEMLKERAENRSVQFQESLTRYLRVDPEKIKATIIPDHMREVVYVTSPRTEFGEVVRHTLETVEIRFAFCMALREEVPPEYVADMMNREVRKAILKQWQSQSLLTRKV